MRPLRLEVRGFSAFREPAIVDFDDVDLFVFVGSTGSGKSSLIDAIGFALYGSVPRYDDAKLVAPVITLGAVEAAVSLTFTVREVEYRAVRVVRRTKKGATTKEARLERGDDVLADDAKGMTAAVADLIGLDFDQFTTCVVLPQGDFARLLHETQEGRQKLLVSLLDLGVYGRAASEARQIANGAGQRLEAIDEQLGRLEGVDVSAQRALEERIQVLGRIVERVDDEADALDSHRQAAAAADQAVAEAERDVRLVGGVEVPAGLGDRAARAEQAAAALAEAETAEAAATAAVVEADAALTALGARAPLETARTRWTERRALDERIARGTAMIEDHAAQRAPLAAAVDAARAAHATRVEALDAARMADTAGHLARQLSAGDDCPVCGNVIESLAGHEAADLEAAEAAVATSDAEVQQAVAALADHDTQATRLDATLTQVRAQRVELAGQLDGAPDEQSVRARLEAIDAAEHTVGVARASERDTRQAVAAARKAVRDAEEAAAADARRLAETRERVAVLGPPPAEGSLAAQWEALAAWSTGAAAAATARAAEQRDVAASARKQAQAIVDALLEEAGRIDLTGDDLAAVRDQALRGRSDAEARLERLVADLALAETLRAERVAVVETRQVHTALGKLLGTKQFQAWLLDDALAVLVHGATGWLGQLSAGRYSLAIGERNDFEIVDHANADERRRAKTLSGGETFLASLALALALAEHVTELSASGASRLEAIFLDEGFGTLDPETLDVVATALEELGSTGRMVGVVSHVRDLAERIPVRFEVRKDHTTARVERRED